MAITFSVIIPTYMEERFIGKTLKYLERAKNGFSVETIVVDSDSPDRTREVASSFGVNVINMKERGISKARNRGALEARGDILIFIDADALVPHRLFRKLSELFKDSAIVGAACNVMPDLSSEPTIFEYAFYRLWAEIKYFANKVKPCTSGENGIIVRKGLFRKLGGFDERLPVIEDYDFVVRAGQHGRLVLMKDMVLRESIRRFREMGCLSFTKTYLTNWIYYSIMRKSMIDEWKPVR